MNQKAGAEEGFRGLTEAGLALGHKDQALVWLDEVLVLRLPLLKISFALQWLI
jgi:hypothetical protein